MTRHLRLARMIPPTTFLWLALACAEANREEQPASLEEDVAPVRQEARSLEAESQLRAFLEISTITTPHATRDSLWACDPDYLAEFYLAVAEYRVLTSTVYGDSVVVAAEVVSVAEETLHPHVTYGYLTKVRIRTDTLHWVMKPRRDGTWGVCEYSVEGYGLGHYGKDDDTEWDPAGWSWGRVRLMADSIQKGATS